MLRHQKAHGFSWLVFFVTASGFYSASYSLFATNSISPALAYLYWPESTAGNHGFVIDIVTLVASFFGMICFGHAADRWGRKFLYGVELILVIVGTLSLAQASTGFNDSMKAEGWIFFWRIVLGFGIGAEYPVTAIIAAEWTPTSLRGVMMASVFLMQSLGQLTASAIAYGVATYFDVCEGLSPQACTRESGAGKEVDRAWRVVIGVGAAPALLAILLRFAIRESARWNLDVHGDRSVLRFLEDEQARRMLGGGSGGNRDAARRTMADGEGVNGGASGRIIEERDGVREASGIRMAGGRGETGDDTRGGGRNGEGSSGPSALGSNNNNAIPGSNEGDDSEDGSESTIGRRDTDQSENTGWQFKLTEIKAYLFDSGGFKHLFGVSIAWFLLDIAYYGLSLNSPRMISRLWKDNRLPLPAKLSDWNTDLVEPNNANIFQVLRRNSARSMITISTGTVPGSIAMILLINYVPRARFMALSFTLLAVIFIITGGAFFSKHVLGAEHHAFNIAMYAIAQFLFNLGPNTITWIIPAEVFPTKYRGTFYGIAGASGKLGAILIQGVLKASQLVKPRVAAWKFATLLFGFAVVMLLGAFIAIYFIPEVQILKSDIQNKKKQHFRPREDRKYPLFGSYKNLILETIVKELDEQGSGKKDGKQPVSIEMTAQQPVSEGNMSSAP